MATSFYIVQRTCQVRLFSDGLAAFVFWGWQLVIDRHLCLGRPHHLHYSTLPDWVQSVGMVMSLVLLAPSWGIMTLAGAWDKLRTDPILKYLVVSLSFYGMATFEGPMMAIKSVNSLSHFTDWTIGHVHSGALDWVAMVSIGAMYHLIPILFGHKQGEMGSGIW